MSTKFLSSIPERYVEYYRLRREDTIVVRTEEVMDRPAWYKLNDDKTAFERDFRNLADREEDSRAIMNSAMITIAGELEEYRGMDKVAYRALILKEPGTHHSLPGKYVNPYLEGTSNMTTKYTRPNSYPEASDKQLLHICKRWHGNSVDETRQKARV